MDHRITEKLDYLTRAADEAGMIFPEIVAALIDLGVEQYHADLLRAEKTYYLPDGTAHVVRCAPVDAPFAAAFDAQGVSAAVRASQARQIDYPAFCDRMAASGCTGYFVSMAGRRALYLGRTAETCVEHFPGQP